MSRHTTTTATALRNGSTTLRRFRGPGARACAIALAFPLALATGCAKAPPQPMPTEKMRQQFANLRVSGGAPSAPVLPRGPVKGTGKGMLVGAGRGALLMIGAGATTGNLLGLALGVGLSPVAAAAGAVIGGIKTKSGKTVDAASRDIAEAASAVKPHEMLRDRVVARAAATTNARVAVLAAGGASPAYSALAGQGVKSVLVIDVDRYGFRTFGRYDPDVQLLMQVTARVHAVPSGIEIYKYVVRYGSRKKNYFELAKDNGALLKSEIRSAVDRIADRVVYVLWQAPPAGAGSIAGPTSGRSVEGPRPAPHVSPRSGSRPASTPATTYVPAWCSFPSSPETHCSAN